MTASQNGNPSPGQSASGGEAGDNKSAESLAAALQQRETELAELKTKHDGAFGRLRILETELEQLRAEKSTREKDEHTKMGNAEALRANFEKDLKAERERAEKAEAKYQAAIVDSGVRQLCAEFGADSAQVQQDLYALTRSAFKADEDGKLVLIDSANDPKRWFKEQVDLRPHLAKNPRKGGSGAEGIKGGAGDGNTITLEDMSRMSDAEFAKAARKNPKLAAEWLRKNPP